MGMDAGEDQREEFVEGLKLDGTMEEGEERSEDESSVLAMEEEEEEEEEETSSSSDTIDSSCSVDPSDVGEDASSSSSSSSTSVLKCSSSNSSSSESLSISRGPLYELSELMSQLPIKRGLSRYYDGRSQSYTSLASVKSVEDLQKKIIINSNCSGRKRLNLCKSYGGGLDKSIISPKAVISKKGQNRVLSFTSSSSSLGGSRRSSLASSANRPPAPVIKA